MAAAQAALAVAQAALALALALAQGVVPVQVPVQVLVLVLRQWSSHDPCCQSIELTCGWLALPRARQQTALCRQQRTIVTCDAAQSTFSAVQTLSGPRHGRVQRVKSLWLCSRHGFRPAARTVTRVT